SSLSASAVVEDLTLADAVLTPPGGGSYDAGILAGSSAGATLTNITVSGTIAANGSASVGGVVGTVALSGTATMSNLTSTVTISNSTQNNAGAAGGLIGSISAVTVGSIANLTQCASYGSISNMGSMGGLIGFVSDDKLTLNISNSLTLTALKNDPAPTLAKQHVGGMIGRLSNALTGKLTVTDSYAAGETTILHNKGTLDSAGNVIAYCAVGGLIGAVKANPDHQSDPDIDLTDGTGGKACVVFTRSYYSKDANNAVSSWTQVHTDGLYHTAGIVQGVSSPVTYYGGGAKSAWLLSEGVDSRDIYCTRYWDTSVWQFTEGLLPVLKRQMAGTVVPPALVLPHLAVSFTASKGDRRSSNVFLRYKGSAGSEALLSVDSANANLMRLTNNQRMLVATDEGTERIPFYITVPQSDGTSLTLTKSVFPGVTPDGRSTDNSIYYINPDGMWEKDSYQWTIYCADALVGLDNTLRGQVDSNGVKASPHGVLAGDTYTLGRDLDLSAYTWWKPIGFSGSVNSADTPFPATLDGARHSLVNLPLLDHSYDSNNNYTPELRKNSRIHNAGLFSTLTGTVKNLSMTVS
ncbi:MAG: hypothetical protein RSB55_08730, partial [Oscillospiraceae bacterium]